MYMNMYECGYEMTCLVLLPVTLQDNDNNYYDNYYHCSTRHGVICNCNSNSNDYFFYINSNSNRRL